MAAKKKKKIKPQPSYESLKKTWYAKLKKSGFEDLEKDEYNFKAGTHGSYFRTKETVRNYYAKSEYYSIAGQFLHNYEFESNLEKVIWEYHANGISIRNIVMLLKKVRIKRNKDDIHKVLKKLVTEMKKRYLVGFETNE